MSTETLLDNNILTHLRSKNIISTNEVAIQSGDLFFAKNVLTDERRMLEGNLIKSFNANESLAETKSRTLLKG
jgi:hypothetical protein